MTSPNFESEPFELSDESFEQYDPEQSNPWMDQEAGRYQPSRIGSYARPSSRGLAWRQNSVVSKPSQYAQTRERFRGWQLQKQRPTPLRPDQPLHRRRRSRPPRPWPYLRPYPWGGNMIVADPWRAPDETRESEYVRWVQHTLNQALDLRLQVDGVMRPEIRSAIRSFQTKQGLPVDGIVGPATERALIEALSGQ